MKITVFNGSIHKALGNTHVIVENFAEGAREAGADVEIIFLAEKEIKYCQACMMCWTKTPGKCVMKDDMAGLLEKFMASDIVVFATPVYVYNVTAILKNFIDRMIPIIDPHLVKMAGGGTGHPKRYGKYPAFGVIASGGFPEQSCCDFISGYFNRIAGDLYSEIVFEIYRGSAILLKYGDQTPLKPLMDEYKRNVRKAGAEIVENMKISDETAEKLNRQLIPPEIYIAEANKYWDGRIAHYKKAKVSEFPLAPG